MKMNISTQNVMDDAIIANNLGVSYGKYKAGIKNDFVDTGYPVRPTEFVQRKSIENKSNSVAFIK